MIAQSENTLMENSSQISLNKAISISRNRITSLSVRVYNLIYTSAIIDIIEIVLFISNITLFMVYALKSYSINIAFANYI